MPSRFVDELPEAHVEVVEPKSPFGGAYQNFGGAFGRSPYGRSRFDERGRRLPERATTRPAGSAPRSGQGAASARAKTWSPSDQRKARGPLTSRASSSPPRASAPRYKRGERVFHQKFGYGTVTEVDGNKLTIEFDKAGRKRVVDSFVDRV